MKRFAPLVLIVLALAAVPVAFADNGTPSAPPSVTPPATAPATGRQPGQQGHPIARIRFEMLRIRLQLVRLRYQIACHEQASERCTQFTQKVVDGLTKLDGNVQDKLTKLNCSSDSTVKGCDLLTKLDTQLKDFISKLGSAPGSSGSSGSSDSSGLDNAAGALAGGKP